MKRIKIPKARERHQGIEPKNYALAGPALRYAPTTGPECNAVINMSQLFLSFALIMALSFFDAPKISAQSKHRSGGARSGARSTTTSTPSGAPLDSSLGAQPELEQLTKSLQERYNRLSSLAADFTQVYTAPGQKMTRESGRLLLKKPGKMRWDYTSPEEKLFVSDGRSMWEYVPSEKVATRSPVDEADDMRAPFAFLLGRGNLKRDFKTIEFSAESPVKAGHKVLRLVPKRIQDFKELVIEVEPGSSQIYRLSIIESDGARSDFLFTNVRENVVASALQFTFIAPPGVEVRKN